MAEKVMQAARYDNYGGGVAGLKHVEVVVPKPKKGEVLVKVEAVALNPVDWKIQKGNMRPLFPCKLPAIPCTDVAGEVVDVGPGVKNFKVGDKVVAMLNHFIGGGLAEFAVTKEKFMTVARPLEVSAAQAVGLAVAGLTALQAVTKAAGIKLDGSGESKNILITAASGGVGHYAVQLAKLGRTHVTATCGARNIELVKSLGADEVIDYKSPEGVVLKSPSGKKYDVVINCTMGIPWNIFKPTLSEKGKVIEVSPGTSSVLRSVLTKLTLSKQQISPLIMIPRTKELNYLVNLVKERKLKTVMDSKYPLSKAEDAWSKSMDGHATGKIIVEHVDE